MSGESLVYLQNRRQKLQRELEQIENEIEARMRVIHSQTSFNALLAKGPASTEYAKKLTVGTGDGQLILAFDGTTLYVENMAALPDLEQNHTVHINIGAAVKFLKGAPSPTVAIILLEDRLKPMGWRVPGQLVELSDVLCGKHVRTASFTLDEDKPLATSEILGAYILCLPTCTCHADLPPNLEDFISTIGQRNVLLDAGLPVPPVTCLCGKVILSSKRKYHESISCL